MSAARPARADTTTTATEPGDHPTGPGSAPAPPWVRVAALVGFVALAQLAGAVGVPFAERATGSWYDQLVRPPFNPPSWVFGPVWTVLYLLIGIAAWRVWRCRESATARTALQWWGLQLVLNAAWTPLFFGAQALWTAFIELMVLWVAVVLTTRQFRRVDAPAAWLMAPYLAWVTFAAVLNGSIAWMN
jgi:translocator protein